MIREAAVSHFKCFHGRSNANAAKLKTVGEDRTDRGNSAEETEFNF